MNFVDKLLDQKGAVALVGRVIQFETGAAD